MSNLSDSSETVRSGIATFSFADENQEDMAEDLNPSSDLDSGESESYDTTKINNYTTCFNLTTLADKPDYRNLKYKGSTEHLNCPICQQPFINPLTTVCGHTFCKECIYECFKMSKDNRASEPLKGCCPLDRTPLDATNINDLFPTPLLIINLVDDLKVYCLNRERGCEWNGCRWELEHHVISDCGYTGVVCNGTRHNDEESKANRCTELVERRFKENDQDKDCCVHKLYQCAHCNVQVTKITEEDHLNTECLFNYQTCDLCSNDMILQKHLAKHQENCSKMGKLQCPASKIGCKWVGNNEPSLEIHLQKNNCQLNQLLPYFEAMDSKILELSKDNEFLQKQINKILDSIIQGKVTNLGYNEPIEEINKFPKLFSDGEDQDKLIYVNYELDRLKFELDEKVLPYINRENQSANERQNIMNGLVNDNFMMKDDLNLQRVLVNSLRKQLQFLLFKNRSSSILGNNLNMGFPGSNGLMTDLDPSELLDMPSRSSSEERLNLKL